MQLTDFFVSDDIFQEGEFATLDSSNSDTPGTLTYCDTIFYLKTAIANPNITCIITTKVLFDLVDTPKKGMIIKESPRVCFFKLLNNLSAMQLIPSQISYGVGTNCSIHRTAQISRKTKIGNNVTIDENVIIKDEVDIGDNTHIHCGVIIGCDGILYIKDKERLIPINHVGGVQIGKNVSILSGAVIVKSVHETTLTKIGDNTLIGIRSTVGHDVQIGDDCIVSGNCVLARKAFINDNVYIGTSSVIREYVSIGTGAQVKTGSIVVKEVPPLSSVSGNFAIDHSVRLKEFIMMRNNRR